MEWLSSALDVFLHLDQHLNTWATTLGPWVYLVLFVVIFCGGLAAVTIAIAWIAAVLVRRHRKKL